MRTPKVWFYRPQLHWFGLMTLLPIGFGGDEFCRRTLILGWSFTGRIVIALDRSRTRALDAAVAVEYDEETSEYVVYLLGEDGLARIGVYRGE